MEGEYIMLSSLLMMLDSEEGRVRFSALFRHYYSYVFQIAYEILQDETHAEDAVQETFVAVIRHFEKIDEIVSRKTRNFLRIITRNKAIDIYNKRKRQYEHFLDDFPQEILSAPEENSNTVLSAIEQLPENFQEILMLRYDSGYSTTEIADMLGISTENARKRLSRAKSAFAEILKREGIL